MVTDLVQNVVKTASNLISDSSEIRQSWSDLSSDELGRAATALLVGLEENAFLLAETVTSEKIIIKPTENIRKYKIKGKKLWIWPVSTVSERFLKFLQN